MNWIIKLSLSNMKKRRSRTFLTILGIVIGIISVVSMISVGFGASRTIMEMLDKESNSKEITVLSVGNASVLQDDGQTFNTRRDRLLNDKTVEKLSELNHVTGVYPVIEINPAEKMGKYEGFATIRGVPQEYMDTFLLRDGEIYRDKTSRLKVIADEGVKGAFMDENTWSSYKDSADGKTSLTGKKVKVRFDTSDNSYFNLSSDEKEELASNSDADENIAESDMEITGTIDNEYSYYFYTDIDNLKSYIRLNSIASNDWNYSSIIVRADSIDSVDDISNSIKNLGFQVENNKQTVEMFTKISSAVRLILGVIGIIAFVVAVIGIVNTMTTSVYDRMSEIGVMKMIGCDSDDILMMFLVESGMLGFVGGVIGVTITYLVNHYVINRVVVKMLTLPKGTVLATLPWWLSIGAVLFAVLISVLAGVIPARWASHLKPLEAATSIR